MVGLRARKIRTNMNVNVESLTRVAIDPSKSPRVTIDPSRTSPHVAIDPSRTIRNYSFHVRLPE